MHNGCSDPRIAASPQTASRNVRLFIDLDEILQSHTTHRLCRAALGIAGDLEYIRLRHAVERRCGLRAH